MPEPQTAAAHRWPGLLLRISVSILLLAGLVYLAHRYQAWSQLRAANPGLLIMGVGCYLVGQLVAAKRWHMLLHHSGFRPSYWRVLRANSIGMYTSNFMPGVAGGDVVRPIVLFGADAAHKVRLYASVVFERMAGITATLLLAVTGAAWFAVTRADRGFLIIGAFVLVLIAGLLVAAYAIRFVRMKRFPRVDAWLAHLREGARHLLDYAGTPRAALATVTASLLFQLCNIGMLWCFIASLGPAPSVFSVILAAPLAWLASMAPLSLNGLGVREGTLVVILTRIGVPKAQVMGAALLGLLPLLLVSAAGALWSLRVFRPKDAVRGMPSQD